MFKSKEQKQAEAAIKKGFKLYMNDALATMQHTQDCAECGEKFEQITKHAGGQLKVITHIPHCSNCQQIFNEIIQHSKTKSLEVNKDVSI